jgi:hypothetical protein
MSSSKAVKGFIGSIDFIRNFVALSGVHFSFYLFYLSNNIVAAERSEAAHYS